MPKKEPSSNFIGKRFGRIVVIADNGIRDYKRYVIGLCDCGKQKEFMLRALKKNTNSCGCIKKGNPEVDLVNKRYGKLVVIEFLGYKNAKAWIKFKCDCGIEKEAYLEHIKTGNTSSCGCLKNTKNGLSHHPLHRVWVHMILRCYDSSEKAYHRYGGRGVRVCDEWRDDFMNFYNWAIERWEVGLQLDKDLLSPYKSGILYSPNFCCFLTSKQNCRNKSNNKVVEYNGESLCIMEWAEKLGVKYGTLHKRINAGWPIEKALHHPLKKSK